MALDSIFKQLQRQTEADLYRQTYRMVKGSQDKILKQAKADETSNRKKIIAREFLWFFASILLGFILAFLFFLLLAEVAPDTLINLVEYTYSLKTFFLLLFALCFVGIYVTRITVWASKSLV